MVKSDSTFIRSQTIDTVHARFLACVTTRRYHGEIELTIPPLYVSGLISNIHLMRQTRHTHGSVESTEMNYSQSHNQAVNQHNPPMTPNYYDRPTYKRKSDFTDNPTYRSEKLMRTTYNMVHGPQKDAEYDMSADKTPKRHFANSGGSSEGPMQKVFDRHLGNGK